MVKFSEERSQELIHHKTALSQYQSEELPECGTHGFQT